MRQGSGPTRKASAEAAVKDIRRAARRGFSAGEKIRVVLEGLRGEERIAEPCRREGIAGLRRREGIATSMHRGWSKEFPGEARAATGPRPGRAASVAWPVTRPGRPPRTRPGTRAARPARPGRSWPVPRSRTARSKKA
jgi:hypothetical protein